MSERKYDLYSHETKRDIHTVFTRMRREDPLFEQIGFDGKTRIWFASRYEDIETILKDDQHFVRDDRNARGDNVPELSEFERLMSSNMLNKDWDDHRRLRNLVSKAFTPKLVREMRPHIQAITDDILAGVRHRGAMDLVADYAYHIPTIVIAELIGIPAADRGLFRAWSDAFVHPTLDAEEQQRMQDLLEEFVAYLRDFLSARRNTPQNDLATALLYAEEDGNRLSEEELFAMLILLIVAGHETTVNLIGNAMLALFLHPEQMRHLISHPDDMPQAVEEFLRYDGPVERALVRFVAEEIELGGQTLPRGSLVIPLLSAANRDALTFADADRLDIHRQSNNHLAFGKGVHYCLGAPLARLEADIALNGLLQSMPDLEPAEPIEQLRYRLVPMFRALESLPVRWKI